jgi:salicylate hydroxylase
MCCYPTSEAETIFQIYFPTPLETPESWGMLSPEVERKEVEDLANRLEKDGWAEQFVKPVREASQGSIVRVGLRARDPCSKWVSGRIVLLGDAAHPPVPYIGQGAMMAVEDAGTVVELMEQFCLNKEGKFSLENFSKATEMYEQIRIPRTGNVLGKSMKLGKTQQDRADSPRYNLYREWSIRMQVMLNGTLPIMLPGATYDYKNDIDDNILKEKGRDGWVPWCA